MNISSTLFAFSLSLCFLVLLSDPGPDPEGICHPQDEKVLKQIEKELTIPPHFQSWKPDAFCCDWYGVECDPKTARVIRLRISDYRVVSGKIPDAIGDLPALQTLIMEKCPNLTGPLPQSLTKLTNLRMLWLTSTNLSGPIPSFLSQLKNLESINLSFNNFSGPIPAFLPQLPKLGYLRLDRNKLTGSIPESLGKLALRSDVSISHNQLTGTIPRSFGNANKTILDFSRNKLQGDISFLFGKDKALQNADFSRNLFEFDMSKLEFPENLVNLDLNHNKIYGSLPVEMTKLELQTFNVSYNRLCGKIPVGGLMQNYEQTVYFHNRCLCGAPLEPCK